MTDNEYKTSCEYCFFARWQNQNGVKTQVGCQFDYLDKFPHNGATVEDAASDDGKTQYKVVLGRLCVAHRHVDSDCVKEVHCGSQRHTPTTLAQKLKEEELGGDYLCVVFVDGIPTEQLVASLKRRRPWPSKRIKYLFVAGPDFKPSALITAANENPNPYQYGITISTGEVSLEELALREVKKDTSMFVIINDKNTGITTKIAAAINKRMIDDCRRFAMVKPQKPNQPLVVLRNLYVTVGGEVPAEFLVDGQRVKKISSVVDKVESLAAEMGQEHMIVNYNEVCAW